MVIITIGIDLAKNIFAVPGVNEVVKPNWSNPRNPAINYCRSSPTYRRVYSTGTPVWGSTGTPVKHNPPYPYRN